MSVALMAPEEGGGVDFGRLRAARRRRLFAAMEAHGLDALLLGRPANVHYASGARQLWTAGARPFAPTCAVVAATGQVHLLSVWDEGVPPEIPRANLFGLSWNPVNLLRSLSAVPGLAGAVRVGTDGRSPPFAELLPWPLVDGRAALWEARAVKTVDELACLAAATAVVEAGLSAMAASLDPLQPGVTERRLLAVFAERAAQLGVPILAHESVACATAATGPVTWRQVPTDRTVSPGQLVVLNPGVLYAGYEGGAGRTCIAGHSGGAGPAGPAGARQLGQRCRTALEALIGACRAGRTGADLRRAWEATGEPLPSLPLAYGIGMGIEPPLIGGGRGDDAELRSGMVLAVQSWVSQEGVGGYLERELVVVGDDAAHPMTTPPGN